MMKRFIAIFMILALLLGSAAFAENVEVLPREDTLYFAGIQWGAVTTWNPIGVSQNNSMALVIGAGWREIMFESLYMWNFLDGELYGLLANDDYAWNEDRSQLTFTIKDAAKWSDGTDVTAADVIRTFDIGVEIGNTTGSSYGPYIESVEGEGKSVVINAKRNELGQPVNPLKILDFLELVPIAQAAWIDTVVERNNGDATGILNDPAEDVVWSGPYTKYLSNSQEVVFIRDDNYWGQDESMWGSLPVPTYLVHNIFSDNAAGEVAMKAGQVDVSQQFIGNVQDLWNPPNNLPISTYLYEPPYGICLTMPTAWFNMNIPVLAENPELRKAIAMAVDYDTINANAMTYQSPTFTDVPRSLMNPTEVEQALYDHDAVAGLQWVGNDVEGAKALLDAAGIVDRDGDGWREWNGEEIRLQAVCPNGWSDWQASMVVVADAGQNIGINITTYYPTDADYRNVFSDPEQTEYAIFMWSPDGSSPSNPWTRVNQLMGMDYIDLPNNMSGNWGQYVNEEADALIKQIPHTTDEAELKALYTELTRIYLTEVPSFSLMYRPSQFHTVNESVWTNFPTEDSVYVRADGTEVLIPPAVCMDGFGIAALYELMLVD